MKNHCLAPHPIDEQEVRADMTLCHASPISAALVETVLPKRFRQSAAGNHDVKNVLERLGFEVRMLSCGAVVALEARQNY